MNIRSTLNNTINRLTSADGSKLVLNDFVVQHIIPLLIEKINTSNIVKPEYKSLMNNLTKSNQKGAGQQLSGTNAEGLILLATIYYLSDLNKYDFHLVNTAFHIGLDAASMVVLLLLNNIYDIETFCKEYHIHGEPYHNITSLKKLSALHKLYYNYL